MANDNGKFGSTATAQSEEVGGISILATVAEQIKSINPRVEEQVVDILVEKELEKRSNAIVILLDRLATLEKDLKKNKPDLSQYDDTGKVVSENYSKGQLEAKNKIKQQIKKIVDSINKALLQKDFSDVYNLSNQKPGDASAKDKKEDGAENT